MGLLPSVDAVCWFYLTLAYILLDFETVDIDCRHIFPPNKSHN